MYIWRALLRVSAQQHPQSGHVALDSTFFERAHASQYYCQRRGQTIKTVKATTLTDTESLAVLDVHCCIGREHDTKAGPRVVRRNADDLRAVAADNGFQDWYSEYEIAALDVEYLVHYVDRLRKQSPTTRSSEQKVTHSDGCQKQATQQSSERRAESCVRSSGADSSVRSSSRSHSTTSRNSLKHYDPAPVPHFQ